MTDQSRPKKQNDPDRAGGLIADAVGEFVEEHPGGAFDPRTFRDPAPPAADAAPDTGREASADVAPKPPMDDERMVGPGEESSKAG
jgi:hypothetical protein